MTAVSTKKLKGVSETLLITLAARAKGSAEQLVSGFSDKFSEYLCKHYSLDMIRYASSKSTVLGTIARSIWFDSRVDNFLAHHPKGTILTLGCGLNTMYERAITRHPDGAWQWIDSDLPQVMELRDELFKDDLTRTSFVLDATALDFEMIKNLSGDEALMVIAEGVLMYLNATDVGALFAGLASVGADLPSCEIVFDHASPLFVKKSRSQPAVARTKDQSIKFHWGIRKAESITRFDKHWQIIAKSADPMTKVGIGTNMFSKIYWLASLGGQFYGCAHAYLAATSNETNS